MHQHKRQAQKLNSSVTTVLMGLLQKLQVMATGVVLKKLGATTTAGTCWLTIIAFGITFPWGATAGLPYWFTAIGAWVSPASGGTYNGVVGGTWAA